MTIFLINRLLLQIAYQLLKQYCNQHQKTYWNDHHQNKPIKNI